mgnify:CR=1 FL=1
MDKFLTMAELEEMRSSFKYGSYSSCGDPEQPIIRKNILRKIEEAILTKKQLQKEWNS